MNADINFRMAKIADCEAILSIYTYYVLNTAITFEYEVPSPEEMQRRMNAIQSKYPFLVAEHKGKIMGYAYGTEFRHRAAYQWSLESTIYLDPAYHGRGIGKLLYQKLLDILQAQGFRSVLGVVALPNDGSIALHLKLGFENIGIFKNVGYKHGKWHSTQWLQLVLNEYDDDPVLPKKVSEVGSGFFL